MNESKNTPEIKRLSRSLKYENNWMKVYEDSIERQNGQRGIYGLVEKPAFSLIIPLDETGKFTYMVEQFRYPLGLRTLEFVQGSMEKEDLNVIENARRELKEETGLAAENIEEIGTFFTAVGFSNQIGHVFLARGLAQETNCLDEEESDLICKKLPVSEVDKLMKENSIKDSGSISAWFLFKSHLCAGE